MAQVTAVGWLLLTAAIVVFAAWYLSWTAGRLDRLHARVEGARSALDAQLVRRASVALELAASGLLDPASSMLLADAAHSARESGRADRETAESNLTRALQATFAEPAVSEELLADPVGADMMQELTASCRRVELARRFHNDAVSAARVVRQQRIVRLLRLAGRAPMPPTFEIDDTMPAALAAIP